MTAYDQTRYPSYTHPQTHPDQLATKATLFGLTPAPAAACLMLELGCGDGTNLASIALSLPQSQFVGLDLASTAIARGQEMTRAMGLQNITLHCGSVLDVGPDFGQFDYIVAHGLYSWVPAAVREKILAICQANLARPGVAYVSYSTKPGGHLKNMLREMMLFHTGGFKDPQERVHQAIALVKFLGEAQPKIEAYRRFLEDELEHLLARDENNVFHDELGEVHECFSFHEFCEQARQHQLQYLAEADYVQMQDRNFPPGVRESLRQLGRNRIAREQYLDFLSFRRFRQTLLCHDHVPLRFGMSPDMLERFHVACVARPVSPEPDLRSETPEKFIGEQDAKLEVSLPLAKAVLMTLADAWPRALPFPEVLSQARTRLGQPPVESSSDREALAIFELFLEIYAPGLARLHLCPPQFSLSAGERPVASPLARWQARSTRHLATLCHAPVVLEDPSGRQLLRLLDGTRDRPTLLREMRGFLEDQRRSGQIEPEAAATPVPDDEELGQNLERTLGVFARCAVLVA